MTKEHTFHCDISTPDGPVLEEEVSSVVLPAVDGYIGILANRSPMTAILGAGDATIHLANGQVRELYLAEGFLRMAKNVLHVLAQEATPLEDLDPEEAWDRLQQAYKLPRVTDEDVALRDEAIQAARVKFNLAQKARKAKQAAEGGGPTSVKDLLSKGL